VAQLKTPIKKKWAHKSELDLFLHKEKAKQMSGVRIFGALWVANDLNIHVQDGDR